MGAEIDLTYPGRDRVLQTFNSEDQDYIHFEGKRYTLQAFRIFVKGNQINSGQELLDQARRDRQRFWDLYQAAMGRLNKIKRDLDEPL